MTTLTGMKVQTEDFQDQRPKIEKQLDDANRQYKIGLWGILIGIFFVPIYGIGVLLILAGTAAALTNRGKRSRLQAELAQVEGQSRQLRLQIAGAEA